MDVSKLIAELAANNVSSFKGYGIEIAFHRKERSTPSSQDVRSAPDQAQAFAQWAQKNAEDPAAPLKIEKNAEQVDPGLAQSLDAELPYDKIRDWSGSPDPLQGPEIPLTGDDVPLTNEPS